MKEKETKKEVVQEEKVAKILDDEKKGFNWFKFLGNVVFWGVFLVFIGLAILAYVNYNALEDKEEPSNYSSMEEYKTEDGENVTVYNYYIYKVVEHYNDNGRQVSLKLWFLDDVRED